MTDGRQIYKYQVFGIINENALLYKEERGRNLFPV